MITVSLSNLIFLAAGIILIFGIMGICRLVKWISEYRELKTYAYMIDFMTASYISKDYESYISMYQDIPKKWMDPKYNGRIQVITDKSTSPLYRLSTCNFPATSFEAAYESSVRLIRVHDAGILKESGEYLEAYYIFRSLNGGGDHGTWATICLNAYKRQLEEEIRAKIKLEEYNKLNKIPVNDDDDPKPEETEDE